MTTTAATELDGKGVEAATIAEAFRRKFHLVRGDWLPGGDETRGMPSSTNGPGWTTP
jgi:hypothetical protein